MTGSSGQPTALGERIKGPIRSHSEWEPSSLEAGEWIRHPCSDSRASSSCVVPQVTDLFIHTGQRQLEDFFSPSHSAPRYPAQPSLRDAHTILWLFLFIQNPLGLAFWGRDWKYTLHKRSWKIRGKRDTGSGLSLDRKELVRLRSYCVPQIGRGA